MRLSKRQFFRAASGAVAFASFPLVLKRAGIAMGEEDGEAAALRIAAPVNHAIPS